VIVIPISRGSSPWKIWVETQPPSVTSRTLSYGNVNTGLTQFPGATTVIVTRICLPKLAQFCDQGSFSVPPRPSVLTELHHSITLLSVSGCRHAIRGWNQSRLQPSS
jgi:hypothetical protein